MDEHEYHMKNNDIGLSWKDVFPLGFLLLFWLSLAYMFYDMRFYHNCVMVLIFPFVEFIKKGSAILLFLFSIWSFFAWAFYKGTGLYGSFMITVVLPYILFSIVKFIARLNREMGANEPLIKFPKI